MSSKSNLYSKYFQSKKLLNKYIFLVIWNPWVDQAREIGDFGDDEYPNMLCVEAGHVSAPVILLPGAAFEASQVLQVSIFLQNTLKK